MQVKTSLEEEILMDKKQSLALGLTLVRMKLLIL
jgi:hypothetical protein